MRQGEVIRVFDGEDKGIFERWKVKESQRAGHIYLVRVENVFVKPPLCVSAVGACVDASSDVDQITAMYWNKEFVEACEYMSGNYAGIPEPLDFFNTIRSEASINATEWPFIVYYYPPGNFVRPLDPRAVRNADKLFKEVYKLAAAVGHTMKAVHSDKVLLRQVDLENLRFLRVTRQYFLAECFAMGKMGQSTYDPHHPYLVLDESKAAPECFDTQGEQTSSTDVYALGRLVMTFLGVRETPRDEEKITESLGRIEQRYKVSLRRELVRALKMALKQDPRDRLQTPGQFLAMLKDPKFTPEARHQQPQRRKF